MLEALGRGNETQAQNKKRAAQQRKQQRLEKWISEEHVCETCGKVMAEYYGSGRFCSRKCANTRVHSEETKKKISESMKSVDITHFIRACKLANIKRCGYTEEHYYNNPNHCKICGKELSYEKRCRKTCSEECLKESKSRNGGYREGAVKNHKSGYYKGIWCDSSYELVWVIYNLDHNIKFKRCKRFYLYEFNGKTHKYYTDFELEDGTIVEIKNYMDEQEGAKIASVKDRPIVVLFREDLEKEFEYVKDNYVYEKIEDLYNKN